MHNLISRLHPPRIGPHFAIPLYPRGIHRRLLGTACAGAAATVAIASHAAVAQVTPVDPPGVNVAATQTDLSSPQAAVMQAFNQRFAADVVIPTYVLLVEETAQLAAASQQFAADPTEETLTALRESWVAATAAWAKGQGFAFGPVHSLGYSAALEFPADAASIEVLLTDPATLEAGNIDAIINAIDRSPSVQGFEAIAYVLYGVEGDKGLDDFSAVDRLYLTRLAALAEGNARELLQVWQEGWEGYAPYETVLATAGEPGNGAYLSVEAGTEEVIRSLFNHLDVIVSEELPEMTAAWETETILPDAVALEHIRSAVSGIHLAYAGPDESALETPSGLSYLVALENQLIDRVIQRSLTAALRHLETAIANPEEPEVLSQALHGAHESLAAVHGYMETDVLALVQR